MPVVENESKRQHQGAIWPVMVAIGVSVLLVGLIVSPLAIAPLGVALALVAVALDGDRPDFEEWASTRVPDGEELSEARQ
jgi:hypothetical protein